MNRQDLVNEILKLSTEDRVWLVEEIWQSLEEEEQDLVLSPEQRKELARRMEEFKKNPTAGCTWEEFVAQVRNSA